MIEWTATSPMAVLEAAELFCEKVMQEHELPCLCQRCAEASYVIKALRNLITAPDKS